VCHIRPTEEGLMNGLRAYDADLLSDLSLLYGNQVKSYA
jgi:hypothetical protein